MMTRAGSGWQYILADLSLILFMVTAAALASADAPPKAAAGAIKLADSPLSPQAEPLALYRAAPGAPPLGRWLRDQAADPRQQLTIIAQYGSGAQTEALRQASALANEAGEAGLRARIVVEPGQGGVTAALAFDAPGPNDDATLVKNGTNLAAAVPSK
jgi:hypothetical protein